MIEKELVRYEISLCWDRPTKGVSFRGNWVVDRSHQDACSSELVHVCVSRLLGVFGKSHSTRPPVSGDTAGWGRLDFTAGFEGDSKSSYIHVELLGSLFFVYPEGGVDLEPLYNELLTMLEGVR